MIKFILEIAMLFSVVESQNNCRVRYHNSGLCCENNGIGPMCQATSACSDRNAAKDAPCNPTEYDTNIEGRSKAYTWNDFVFVKGTGNDGTQETGID